MSSLKVYINNNDNEINMYSVFIFKKKALKVFSFEIVNISTNIQIV